MVYLFESEIPENKSIFFAMTHIFGLGKSNSSLLCKKIGFSKNLKVKNMSKEQINKLIFAIEFSNLIVDLKKKKITSVKKVAFYKII